MVARLHEVGSEAAWGYLRHSLLPSPNINIPAEDHPCFSVFDKEPTGDLIVINIRNLLGQKVIVAIKAFRSRTFICQCTSARRPNCFNSQRWRTIKFEQRIS